MKKSLRALVVPRSPEVGELIDYSEFGVDYHSGYFTNGIPVNFSDGSATTRLHTGKEWLNLEGAGLYENAARMHDPLLGRFTTSDALADKYHHLSPYTHCASNPVNYVDFDGNHPIYSISGQFLGTDDEGLGGEFFVLKDADFEQSMLPSLAQELSVSDDEVSEYVLSKIQAHYNNLSKRPDYDGKLTLLEAMRWYRSGKGESLYVDLSSITFPSISDFEKFRVKEEFPLNLFLAFKDFDDMCVYGNITIVRQSEKDRTIRAKPDIYDFDMHPWVSFESVIRNAETFIGKLLNRRGVPYTIHFYGTASIPK